MDISKYKAEDRAKAIVSLLVVGAFLFLGQFLGSKVGEAEKRCEKRTEEIIEYVCTSKEETISVCSEETRKRCSDLREHIEALDSCAEG